MKILNIKVRHPEFAKDGSWFRIAHSRDTKGLPTKIDETIYYFMNDDVKFKDIKAGDKIELDETFEVMEVGETLTFNKTLMRDKDDKHY